MTTDSSETPDKHGILFPKLNGEQLACLQKYGSEVRLEPGETLFNEGDAENEFYAVLEGRIRVTKRVAGADSVLTVHEPGEFTGALTMLTGGASIASAKAIEAARLVRITQDQYFQLLSECPPAGKFILATWAERRPEAEALPMQREKLAALGTMAAGLAHELNNPATAARRAANQLGETLHRMQPLALKLGALCFTPPQKAFLNAFQEEAAARVPERAHLSAMDRSDMEDAMAQWLEPRGAQQPWDMAATLVNAGVTTEGLDGLEATFDHDALCDMLAWLDATLSADALVREMDQSTSRVTDLVKAIKSYTYMDQAPVQNVDIREGLDNTLTILGHKLKKGDIKVVKDYAPNLPRISAYGSELNQVWTNILDNAIDALNGHGTIRIATCAEADQVIISISDDGPGIPPEVQTRMFEPFFTTKGVGKGTGLGLEIAHRIVVKHHHGDIKVTSRPGETRFDVRLPILLVCDLPHAKEAAP